MQILERLMREPGEVVHRAELERILWPAGDSPPDALRSQVYLLRRALVEAGFEGLETVHGIGFRLQALMAMGLQKRISLALTAVITLFVVAQGYLAYSSLEQQEDDLVDEIVMSETTAADRAHPERRSVTLNEQPHRLGPNLVAWLLPAGGPWPELPDHLADLAVGPHMLHRAERVYHAVIEDIPAGRVVVQFDATQNEEFVYRFGRYLIINGLLCIALGWAISTILARIVVTPFRRLSERLTSGAAVARDQRQVARSDEETMLLQAFDQAQRRLEESLAREREFAANVRHEVHTPLSALRTDAEMMLLTESLSETGQQRLRRMMGAVDGISSGSMRFRHFRPPCPARPSRCGSRNASTMSGKASDTSQPIGGRRC